MELRSPDPALNPYLAFALVLAAGLDGIARGAVLPPALDMDLYTADHCVTKALPPLPDSLDRAIALTQQSAFVKAVLGEDLLQSCLALKKRESSAFAAAKDRTQFYRDQSFGLI
jgi:glutamine synthetase